MTAPQSISARLGADAPALLAVYEGRVCIGHLLRRGAAGVEAFSSEDVSFGMYESEAAATSALWRHAHGQGGTP